MINVKEHRLGFHLDTVKIVQITKELTKGITNACLLNVTEVKMKLLVLMVFARLVPISHTLIRTEKHVSIQKMRAQVKQ